MANYANLKSDIAGVIRTNNNEEITGDILQEQLLGMVDSLGAGYQYKGVATPTTAPGAPDENVFYIASTAGTYTNFGGLVVAEGEVAILKYNGSWTKEVTGAATAAQVTQLGQEVEERLTDFSLGDDIGYSSINLMGIDSATTAIATSTNNNKLYYFPVSAGSYIYIKLTFTRDRYFRGGVYASTSVGSLPVGFFEEKNTIRSYEKIVPIAQDGYFCWQEYDVSGYNSTKEIKDVITTDKIEKLEEDVAVLKAENTAMKSAISALNSEVMNLDKTSIIAVDLMQMVHARNLISSLDYMEVVSSTESTITLSSSDIANFPTTAKYGTVAAVGFSDGTYKVVYFGVPSGTTLPRASFDTTDLTNATTIQSLHDTLSSGNGQHLSPSGYIAMGKFVADEMVKKTSMIDKNWIGGLIFNTLGLSKGYQNTDAYNAVYDLNDNIVCQPIFYNWLWGGYTPNGNSTSNKRGVESANINGNANGWVAKCYRFIQGKKDAYVEFPILVSGEGFVEIQAANLSEKATSTGNCKVGLYTDGVLVGEQNLVLSQTKFIFENVSVTEKLSVRFTLLENADTDVVIYSIGFWKMYAGVQAPIITSSTRIAVLGDSWTQFPGTGLSDHADWNTIVERPDGTQGGGMGYFPKALASFTGAQVDNWGKSDMRADNWGLAMIDTILDFARYDYLIIEFYINDYNSGQTSATWISNIKAICDKCKRANVRPVFIMPSATNSYSQYMNIGIWHEAVVKGLGAV